MRVYRIYFIRHGITKANLEGRYVGSTDVPLCEQGKDEIRYLAENYEYPNVGKVYVSPMKRCLETAEIIYPYMKPQVVEGLREYDFGVFEGKLLTELKINDDFNNFMRSSWSESLKGAEDMGAFLERIIQGLDSIIMDMMHSKISEAAVVTHGGVIMQLLANCGLPKRKPLDWGVGNGRGYTFLVNASLWGNNKMAEVYTAIPFGDDKTNEVVGVSFEEYSK